jgi:hypothetical protein
MPRRAAGVRAVTAAAVVIATATAAAAAGCSGDGPVTHPIVRASPITILVPSPGSSASAQIVESSDTVLQAHLLKLTDLPAGWRNGTAAGIGAGAAGGSNCEAISDPAYRHLPLHAEADFASGSSLPSVTETLAYGSAAQVDGAWTSYVQAMASCGHFAMRLAGQTLSLTLTQIPFPRTGDATDARQAVTTEGRTASITFVLIHKGNLLESVTYADWGTPNTTQAQRLAEEAAAKTADIE